MRLSAIRHLASRSGFSHKRSESSPSSQSEVPMMESQALQGPEKLQQVTQLLGCLEKDVDHNYLSSAQREQILLQLRQHGTGKENAGPIYSKDGIGLLAKYGGNGETASVRRAALRCVANALLLEPSLRQAFVDTGCCSKLTERLKCDSSEDELVISRLLFYCTYNTTVDFGELISKNSLLDGIIYQINRHTKQLPRSGRKTLPQVDELAFTDTVKLMHNIAALYPDLAPSFSPAIGPLFKFISRIDIPPKPLDGLTGFLIKCLARLDLEGEKGKPFESNPIFPTFNQNCNVDKLINILDKAVPAHPPDFLEVNAVPLIGTLTIIYSMAPDGCRQYMQWLLLPEESDGSQPIGKSDTLSSRMLRLSTGPYPILKSAISQLLFSLSDCSPENLTRNIGFGFASGLLASNGLDIPRTAGEAFSTSADSARNPITGQRYDAEPVDTGPPMSKAEREREAERLFVLFERARANGFLNVENPVRVAQQQGKLEELSDSDSD